MLQPPPVTSPRNRLYQGQCTARGKNGKPVNKATCIGFGVPTAVRYARVHLIRLVRRRYLQCKGGASKPHSSRSLPELAVLASGCLHTPFLFL
jgi:hypothetical protein